MAKEIQIVPLGYSVSKINEGADDQIDAAVIGSFGGIKNFKDCDVVFGPDGTRYEPKFICSVVEDAISTINIINDGVIKDFLASLPFVYTFALPTMATDGKHIFMNPGFIMQLLDWCDGSPVGVAFVIIHEVYHNLFKHQMREAADPGKFTDHKKCNIAQDYEINWVIEHSYPDKRSEQEAADEGESVLDENGNRVQLFAGITDTCKGLISDKFRNTVWEEIYDQLDGTEGDNQEEDEEDVEEIDFSDDYKDGFKQGVEDAIRTLRAKGLVESLVVSDKLLFLSCALNEGKTTIMQGTYDDGYNEGYNRVMQTIQGLLAGASGGMQGGGMQGNKKEVEIPGLPTIKPKFNIPPGAAQQQKSKMNMPKIDMSNQQSQGGSGDSQNQSNQNGQQGSQGNQQNGNQSNGQQGSQSGQQGSQSGQQGGQQGGQSGQQGNQPGSGQAGQGQGPNGGDDTANGKGGNGKPLGDKDATTPGMDQTQDGHVGTGSSNIHRSPNGQGSGSSQGSQDSNGQSNNGNMSTADAQNIMDGIPMQDGKSGKPQIIGIANKGYSGKGGAQGNHVITQDEGRKLAKDAGFDDGSDSDTYMGKDDPFNDKEKIRRALAGLKKSSTVLGSNGTPGCGMFDNIDGLLVSLFSPTVNWKKMLERYMKGFQSKLMDMGYSKKGIIYGRYNRFKDYEGETAQRILICIDTSGSVMYSGDYLRHIVADTAEITCKLGIHYVNVIQFCDGVYKDTEFKKNNVPPAKEFAIDANQSGGTSFMPVFEYIHKNYTMKHKNFQAVIFFTDDDVYSCRLPKISDIKKFANNIVWVVLSSKFEKLPYGKLIAIAPDDFSAQLSNYETTENTSESEYEEIDENIINESHRNCMNKRIYTMNEGVFNNHKLAGQRRAAAAAAQAAAQAGAADDTSAEVPARQSTPAPKKKVLSVMDKRKLAIDALRASGAKDGVIAAAKQELYQQLKPWFDKFFSGYTFYKDESDISSYNRDGRYVVMTDYNTVDFHGDLKLVGPVILENWPEGLTFENVYGNLDVGMCSTINQLPKGLPMTVRGDFRITNMRRLEDLNGAPIYVDGNVIVTACPNMKSLFGAPKRCGYFYSDKFEQEDYLDYISSTYGIKESAKLRAAFGNKPINEAFKANKLTELAKNPNNKEALQAMKNINIIWSEIPDEIINPIYNNVARSLAKRRDDNASGEYGIYIWCDSTNKINIIGTGNNMKEWGNGKSWLFLADGVMDTINQRINMVRSACRGSSTDRDECIEIGIKYDNKNVSAICQKGTINQNYLTYTHLLLLPDLCCKAYLIQGTKDPRSSYSDSKVAHFSYKNSAAERQNIQKSRAQAITDIIVQGRNLNPNDPAYKKYYENYFITDEKLIKRFILVKNIFDFRMIISDMMTSMTNNAKKVRAAILNLQDNPDVDDEIFDGLYRAYTSVYVRRFRSEANELLTAIEEIINNKKYNQSGFADTVESISYALELAYNTDDPNSSWGKRGRYSDIYYSAGNYKGMVNWVRTYAETIQTFAEIMAAIDNIRKGNIDKLKEYSSQFLH